MNSETQSRKVFRQGNSLAITIPSDLIERLSIRDGDKILFEEQEGKMIITKERNRGKKNVNSHL